MLSTSSIVRKGHESATYHNKYILREQLMRVEFAQVVKEPHPDLHQQIMTFRTLHGHLRCNSMMTGEMNLVEWCQDMIRIYTETVYLLHFRMGYCTTINYCNALYLMTIWDWIGRYNIPMPTKRSYTNLITSRFNFQKVDPLTCSQAMSVVFPYYTAAGLFRIRSFNSSSTCPIEHPYWSLLRGVRRLNNGY